MKTWDQPKLVAVGMRHERVGRGVVDSLGRRRFERAHVIDVRCRADQCPAHRDGRCRQPYVTSDVAARDLAHVVGCDVFVCPECGRWMPWCCGVGGSDMCGDCAAERGNTNP